MVVRLRAEEMLLGSADEHVRETYIFEPSPGEESFGYLLAAGQTWSGGGMGAELLESVVTAIQKEYYRDAERSASTSFEMALHQANLILHDMAEQGVRDWMNFFDVAVGVLVDGTLHVSVAGEGRVFILRRGQLNDVSSELGQSPILNPLQSFSQVASGTVLPQDMLLFTNQRFEQIYQPTQVLHFGATGKADVLVQKLTHWYQGEGDQTPLALVAASVEIAHRPEATALPPVSRDKPKPQLTPRKPVVIKRVHPKQVVRFFIHLPMVAAAKIKNRLTSAPTDDEEQELGEESGIKRPRMNWRERGEAAVAVLALSPKRLRDGFGKLPASSKVFAVLSFLLLIALGGSVLLLREKRATDADIEAASEILHDARLRKEAAQTALIYDNREQAKGLLAEARTLTEKLGQTGLYADERDALVAEITASQDQLQRITRATQANTRLIGDFKETVSAPELQNIFLLEDWIYSYDPRTNAVARMNLEGQVEVSLEETKEIGFFRDGAAYKPDKMITFLTDPAGLAIFDARDQSLSAQSITLPHDVKSITDMALYGNRLYVADGESDSILSFNKTLRGYSGGSEWLMGETSPKDIVSLAVDGNIYSLHANGTIRQWFKGEEVEFTQETVDPILPGTAKILTTDELQYLYVVDKEHGRVVIYTKKGSLLRQLFFEEEMLVTDIAVPVEEDRIFVLSGTQVMEVQIATP